jgi:hypothetical protein
MCAPPREQSIVAAANIPDIQRTKIHEKILYALRTILPLDFFSCVPVLGGEGLGVRGIAALAKT